MHAVKTKILTHDSLLDDLLANINSQLVPHPIISKQLLRDGSDGDARVVTGTVVLPRTLLCMQTSRLQWVASQVDNGKTNHFMHSADLSCYKPEKLIKWLNWTLDRILIYIVTTYASLQLRICTSIRIY